MTAGAIGLDVFAFLLTESGRRNNLLIPPGETRNIPTGLLIQPPEGTFVMVCSRSGMAQDSLFVANQPGIVDPDYRGELKVLLYNGSTHESVYIQNEQRIAQLIVLPALFVSCFAVEALSETSRGGDGFGSTGS